MTEPRIIVPIMTPSDREARAGTAPSATLTYHGGRLLTSVEVVTVFWGAAWQQSPQSDLIAQINTFFDTILTSSLMDVLAEYSSGSFTIGHGTRSGTATIVTSEPGDGAGEVTDAQIQTALQTWTMDGTLTQPTANTLYFVYLPPSVTSLLGTDRSCQQFCGYHNHVGGTLFYAVEPYLTCTGCLAGGTTFEALTEVSSHELCEAITDPALDAWTDDTTGNEIGDICNFDHGQLDGYTVQREWSNKAGACILSPTIATPSGK